MNGPKNICAIVAILITGGADKLVFSHLSALVKEGYTVNLYSITPMNKKSIFEDEFRENGVLLKDYNLLLKLVLNCTKYFMFVLIYPIILILSSINVYNKQVTKPGVLSFIENRVIFKICIPILFIRILIDTYFNKYSILSTYHYSTYIISYYIEKILHIPVVYTEISSPAYRENWIRRDRTQRYLKSFHTIFAPSKHICNELKQYEGLAKDCIIVPFLIEEAQYKPCTISTKAKSFGIIARLTREKNQDILIRVLSIVLKSKPDAKLVLVGRGEEESKYKSLVKELNLVDNVDFIPGFEEINEIIDMIDIFVLCSDVEGMPLVLLEALYYSKPIIVNDVGSTSELIVNGFNGFMVDKTDLEDIANKIISIMDNEHLFKTFSNNSKCLYNEKFNSKKTLETVVYEYNKIVQLYS